MGPDSLRCELLGGFDLSIGGNAVEIRGSRGRQIFAYLILQAGTPVSVDRLTEALWSEDPPASARNSIQRFISDLRRDLGPAGTRIEQAGNGYRIRLTTDDSCDVLDVERDLPAARAAFRSGRPADALSLVSAVASTRRQPLAGLESAAFVDDEQRRQMDLVAECGELEAESQLALGNPAAAVVSARRLLIEHPYRERLCLTLATALVRQGRANDALDEIVTFRARLASDLGLDPSPAVTQAELEILTHTDSRASTRGGGQPQATEPITPVRSTVPLIGRDALVAESVALLETERVVTLTGTGGIGKTSVARASIDLWHSRCDGISRYVSFEDVSPQGIAATIGQAVGTSATNEHDPIFEIVDRVCAEVDLLVLDNCEHLVDELRDFLDKIFERHSNVRVLATSRRPLGVALEHVLPVEPLDITGSRLLLEQQLKKSAVQVSQVDDAAFAELLNELDGLPLAIELAGACLRSVGVRDLLTRWEYLDTAEQPNRGGKARHQSIASALRSTLEQLDAEHIDLLRHCALFPGDFDLAAIEALAGSPVFGPLSVLVNYSLLEVDHVGSAARYRMLVPIRADIRSRFEPIPLAARSTLVGHYAVLAEQALDSLKGHEPKQGVALFRSELTNLAFAFEQANELDDLAAMGSIVASVGLANGMSSAIGAKGHLHSWGTQLRQRIADDQLPDALAARLWTAAAWGLYGSGDGGWYLRWEAETPIDDVECLGMAAIARFSRGQSAESWELLRDLDLASIVDPFLRSLLCGIGAVIAFEVGAPEGHALTELATQAAQVRQSPGATFFATLARSAQALTNADVPTSLAFLESNVQAIEGHDLVTLENMSRAALAMTAGVLLKAQDPAATLADLVGRYLDQHSLDPASVAMALDAASLRLDQADRTEDAAVLLGLLDRLGLSMVILQPARVRLEAKVSENPLWAKARAAGSMRSTFDVLEATRDALVAVAA